MQQQKKKSIIKIISNEFLLVIKSDVCDVAQKLLSMMSLCTFCWEEQVYDQSCLNYAFVFDIKDFSLKCQTHQHAGYSLSSLTV